MITSRVSLTTKGGLSDSIIVKIPKGEDIKVLDGPVSGWYKISWGSRTGNVHKDYITVDETAALKAELAKPSIGLVFVHDLKTFHHFKSVTAFDIALEPDPAQIELLTKKKGYVGEITRARLTGDERSLCRARSCEAARPSATMKSSALYSRIQKSSRTISSP